MSSDPQGAIETRLAPWAVERSLANARWVGAAFALLQALLIRPEPYSRPYLVQATVALGLLLVASNVLLLPCLRRRRVTTRLASLMFVLDVGVIFAFVWLYTDNLNSSLWALFIVAPLEAAYRWKLRGAIGIAVLSSLYYAFVRYASAREFGYPFTITDVTYVAGLVLVEAVAVGGMAQRLGRERDALEKLHRSALALNSRLEHKPILSTVAREAARVLDADLSVVWVPDRGSFVPAGSFRLPAGLADTLRLPMVDPAFGEAAATEAYRTRAPTWNTGLRRDRPQQPHLESIVLPRPWRAVVCVPIVHEDETLGVLSCYLRKAQRFDPDEIARIEALAALAAVAITNASAYTRERQALESMREVDAMKDDFLSTISHELRTPLTSVEGFATTLMRKWDDIPEERRRDFVARIERQATSLHVLISELLDFSRLQAGRYTLHIAAVHALNHVTETVARLDTTLQAHEVKVDIPEDVVCWADPIALERILENLLTNAARYSPAGAPILIAAGAHDGWVDIGVSDEGLGIPLDEEDHIFQRFYRGASDEVRSIRGTGVGLAVVKELVEAHGGTVSVESTPGTGSTFVIKLPATRPSAY